MARRRQGESARNGRHRPAALASSGSCGTYSAYAASTQARGSAVFDPGQGHNRFAGFLLGGVAAAALLTVSPRPARAGPDACTVVVAGVEITCLGDQSNGIASGVDFTADTYETLNVNNLTGDITPASGVSGIVFTHDDASITLNSDLGDFEIVTTGDDAFGILAQSSGLPGSSFVTVNHQGNTTTTGNSSDAISALSQYDDVSITSVGDLSTAGSGAEGIWARAYDGAVTVNSTGDITTQGDDAEGIWVNGYYDASVTSVGNISTQGDGAEGIRARSNGDIVVISTGNITTTGASSEGIDARSSGDGDVVVTSTGNITTTGASSAGIDARSYTGRVMVTSTGDITTGGDDSHGIRAYSEYDDVTVTSTGNITTSGALSHGIDASTFFYGDVAVVSTGDIVTTGEESFGIRARADGFSSDSDVSITSTGNITTAGAFADGIQASAGYGNVTVDSTGDITTQGAGAEGIRALTDYGAATVSSTGDIATQGDSAEGISVNSYYQATVTSVGNISTQGVGAEGIRVSSYGDVVVTSTGNITTTGPSSEGIDATSDFGQVMVTSIGDITTIGVDSEGIRAYSEYGNVTVSSTGNITTTGDFSHAIYAEAYAGGDITVMSAGNLTTAGVDADGIRASADYGAVTVESIGDIATQGLNAQGISVSAYDQAAVTSEGDISTQGDGASGMSVRGDYQATVTSLGHITTAGDNAQGIRASSDGAVSVDSTGTITTAGEGADGIDATSQAGQVDVTSIGDIATAGGFATGILARTNQGNVTIDSTGNITTTGDDSGAIHAATYTSGGVSITSTGNITTSGTSARGIYGSAGFGNLTITSTGDITTTGTGSNEAIVAFAIGNVTVRSTGNIVSAGDGIYAVSDGPGSVEIESIGNITVSGNGNDGIRAEAYDGLVTITSTGDITTGGNSSDGIRAISDDGQAVVTSTGSIATTGIGSDGIFAYATQQATVDHSGSITTGGADSHGIHAVSRIDSVEVTVNAGAVVQGGSGTGAGVAMEHGTSGTVTNYGLIGALSGLAVTSTGASNNSVVDNFGTVAGNVVFAGTTNMFNNEAGGLFNSGTTVDLGSSLGVLENRGTVNPGGLGTIATTMLTGEFVQYAQGTLQVDIDGATGTSDLLDITGGADVDGLVRVNALSLVQTAQTFTIVNAADGVFDFGLTAVDTAAVDYELDFTNPTQILLTATVDLSGAGAPGTPNQQAIANNLDTILTNGGAAPDLGALITTLAGLPDQASFLAALDQLSPEVYAALVQSGLLANLAFADGLMSCKMAGGYEMVGREGACSWLKVAGRITDRDPAFDSAGWEETTGGISGGVQVAVGEVARLGIAGAYERVDLKSGSTFDSDADRVHVGTVLKLDLDGLTLAASATGGYAWHDTRRDVPILAATAESDQTAWWAGGHVRAAYTMRTQSGFYLAPSVDGGVTHTRLDGFTETGAGGANLTVSDAEETYINLSPALEIGHTTVTGGGTEIRPFARFGFTQLFGDGSPTYSAAFTGAPAGVPGFQVASELDKAWVDLWAGADVFMASGLNMRVYYQGGFARNTESHAAGLKAAWAF